MQIDRAKLRELAISDSGFVFDPFTGHTFTANATGISILRGLAEGLTSEQLVVRLQDAFDSEGDDLARDVDEFSERLREHGLAR